jgi:hypothetical protein
MQELAHYIELEEYITFLIMLYEANQQLEKDDTTQDRTADLALIQSEYYRTMYYKHQSKTHIQIPELVAGTFFEWHYRVKQGLSDDVFH